MPSGNPGPGYLKPGCNESVFGWQRCIFDAFLLKKLAFVTGDKGFNKSPGGVAQWISHPPQVQKTRVRIPPGYKVFRENIAVLLFIIDAICLVCVLKKRNTGIGPNYYSFNKQSELNLAPRFFRCP
jgi:hypothetical protein